MLTEVILAFRKDGVLASGEVAEAHLEALGRVLEHTDSDLIKKLVRWDAQIECAKSAERVLLGNPEQNDSSILVIPNGPAGEIKRHG